MSSAGRDALVAMLSRLKSDFAALNLAKPDVARASLQGKYPLSGDYLIEVQRLCQRGIDEGWLRPSENPRARPARLAAASKHFPFSIDAACLSGASPAHGHPRGEVSVCWALSGVPRYCGREAGWLAWPPGSKHLPEVVGGTMFLLQFLPDGQVDWDVTVATASASALTRRRSTVREPAESRTRRAAARG